MSEQWNLFLSRSRGPAIRCRFRLTCGRARTDHAHRHATAAAVSVRPIRGQAPGCIIRVPLRLHAAPSAGGRSRSGMASLAHRRGRGVRRSGNPDRASALHRIRHRGRHRLASRQAAFRSDIWLVAGVGMQVSLSPACRRKMATLRAAGRAALDLHDGGSGETRLGAQHSRGRSSALFDYVSHHGR